tara:strand:+ start:3191 stop:3580 length:390 start_codon:yes stop_codon:yes gene_type:complete
MTKLSIELFTLEEILKEINNNKIIVSEKTLKQISQELGFRKGRTKVNVYNRNQVNLIVGEIICQRFTNQDRENKTRLIESGVQSATKSTKSLRARLTKDLHRQSGTLSKNKSKAQVVSLKRNTGPFQMQ